MFELTDLVLGTFLIIVFLVGVGLLVREAIEELRPQRSVGYRRSRRPRLRFKKSVDESGERPVRTDSKESLLSAAVRAAIEIPIDAYATQSNREPAFARHRALTP